MLYAATILVLLLIGVPGSIDAFLSHHHRHVNNFIGVSPIVSLSNHRHASISSIFMKKVQYPSILFNSLHQRQSRTTGWQRPMSRYSYALEKLKKEQEKLELDLKNGLKPQHIIDQEKAQEDEQQRQEKKHQEELTKRQQLLRAKEMRRQYIYEGKVKELRSKAQKDRYVKNLFKKYPQLQSSYNYTALDGTVFHYPFIEVPMW
jgi:hypothetical protein